MAISKFVIVSNNSKSHPYLNQLIDLQSSHAIQVQALEVPSTFFKIRLTIKGQSWDLYIEDEYQEFEINTSIKVFLSLRALEDFEEAQDYEHWCRLLRLESDVAWESYFEYLKKAYRDISSLLGGTVDSFIPSLDYQLKSGDYYYLLLLTD